MKPKYNHLLKELITEKYGTQEAFAFVSEINEALISKIIRGMRKPTIHQKTKIADLLNVSITELFPEKNNEKT